MQGTRYPYFQTLSSKVEWSLEFLDFVCDAIMISVLLETTSNSSTYVYVGVRIFLSRNGSNPVIQLVSFYIRIACLNEISLILNKQVYEGRLHPFAYCGLFIKSQLIGWLHARRTSVQLLLFSFLRVLILKKQFL